MKRPALFLLILPAFFLANCSAKQDKDKIQSQRTDGTVAGDIRTVENITDKIKDEITIQAPDKKKIAADYIYLPEKKDVSQPLVILIHQFRESKEQWPENFIDSLTGKGYKVLRYDIRGHGKSSAVDFELSRLLSDPEQAPQDLKGVFEWSKQQTGIDTSRIAVIGTSIGGNLACYAKYNLGAKTIIAVSNGKKGFEDFMGIDERMMAMGRVFTRISSVLFVCGSGDGDHEKDQRYLYENFLDDPKEMKVYKSAKHGKYLIEEHPEIYELCLNWLAKNL